MTEEEDYNSSSWTLLVWSLSLTNWRYLPVVERRLWPAIFDISTSEAPLVRW